MSVMEVRNCYNGETNFVQKRLNELSARRSSNIGMQKNNRIGLASTKLTEYHETLCTLQVLYFVQCDKLTELKPFPTKFKIKLEQEINVPLSFRNLADCFKKF